MIEIIEYIQEKKLDTKDRYRSLTYRRFFLFDILRKKGLTLYQIAELFNKDHATVLYGIKMHKLFTSQNDAIYLTATEEERMKFKDDLIIPSLALDVLCCTIIKDLNRVKWRIRNNNYPQDQIVLTF